MKSKKKCLGVTGKAYLFPGQLKTSETLYNRPLNVQVYISVYM